MYRLLSANLERLFRSRIFHAQLGLTALFSIVIVWCNYSPELQASASRLYLEDVFFTLYQFLGFVLAAAISLIVGAEYSDGTIRNKLTVGCTRLQVYAAGLIASTVSSCLVLLTHGVLTYGLGSLPFGSFRLGAGQIAAALLSALLAAMFFSALYTAIGLHCSNKAAAAVLSLLLVLGLVYLSSAFGSILGQQELTYESITISADGTAQLGPLVRNPAYVSGLRRTLYQFFYDLLPTGQLLQMYSLDFSHCLRWPAYSASLLALVTALGFAAFRKKEIR